MGKVAKIKRPKESSAPEKCPKVWEKARRDRMKVLFDELSRLLPKYDPAVPPSRPEIITKAMAHIRDLQAQNEDLLNGGFDEVYKKKIDTWKRRVKELLSRVEQLSGILKMANIHLPPLALDGVPAWTTNRPKLWTEKVSIPEEKMEEVIKQLTQSKKKRNKCIITVKNKRPMKRKKKDTDSVPEVQSKENQPTHVALINTKNTEQKEKNVAQNQAIPLSVQSLPLQQTTIPQQVPNLIQQTSVAQAGTFILTNQGNLVPILTPNASVLTPVIINRPPPLLVLQTPTQPRPLPVILSRPPPNKRRIERESTVMTFANKRPISALSKHSHPRRGGKCVAHKTANRDLITNELQPLVSSSIPAVSPTAAFLNSFPVVATPKVVGCEESEGTELEKTGTSSLENVNPIGDGANNKNDATTSKNNKNVSFVESLPIEPDACVPPEKKIVPGARDTQLDMNEENSANGNIVASINNVSEKKKNIQLGGNTKENDGDPNSRSNYNTISSDVKETENIMSSSILTSDTLTSSASLSSDNFVAPLVTDKISQNYILPVNTNENDSAIITSQPLSAAGHQTLEFSAATLPIVKSSVSSSLQTNSAIYSDSLTAVTNVNISTSTTKNESTNIISTAAPVRSIEFKLDIMQQPVNHIPNENKQLLVSSSSIPTTKPFTVKSDKFLFNIENQVSSANISAPTFSIVSTSVPALSTPAPQINNSSSLITATTESLVISPQIQFTNSKCTNPVTSSIPSSVFNSPVTSTEGKSWELTTPQTTTQQKVAAKFLMPVKSTADQLTLSPSTTHWPPAPAIFISSSSSSTSSQDLKTRKYSGSITSLTTGRSDNPSVSGSMNFSSSWAPAPIISKVSPASASVSNLTTLIPHLPTSQPSGLSSQNSWLPIPQIYTNDNFNKSSSTTTTTTWRPMPVDQVWTGSEPIAEPWKRTPTTQPQLAIKSPYEVVSGTSLDSAKISAPTTANFYIQTNTTPSRTVESVPHCETTWSSGILRPPSDAGYLSNSSSANKLLSIENTYITTPQPNESLPQPFNSSYKPPIQPMQPLVNENRPWSCSQHIQPFQSILTQKTYQPVLPKPPAISSSSNYSKPVGVSSYSIVANLSSPATSYSSNNSTINFCAPKNNVLHVPSTSTPQHVPSLNLVEPIVSSSYPLPNSSICNPFGMNTYAPPLLKTPMTDPSYSNNFANTFASDTSYSSKPSFSLDVSKALLNDSPYSLAVPKTSVCESSFFSNVPIYQPAVSTMIPTETTYTALSVSKTLMGESVFSSSVPSSSASDHTTLADHRTKVLDRAVPQKEPPLLLPPSSTNLKNFSDQKMHGSSLTYNATCAPVSSSDQMPSRSTGNSQKHVSDSSTSLWNAPYFSQTAATLPGDTGVGWGQLDYLCTSESKDNRPKPPINWMTEPDQRNEGLCHVEDPFQPRYQNVFDRKDPQGHNILDFCFNSTVEDDVTRSKNRKKDSEPTSQDYFGWISMKVDPLVVPCTLPTLVGDLALGSDPLPAKRCKVTTGQTDSYSRGAKPSENPTQIPQEPFTNLSKNIFDISQSEPSKPGNLPETIVLKNIFELPSVSSGKQRTTQGQNSFLSVSQLVEPHNMETGSHKSDYTYYSQRSGKGKRGSGWKCGEKKCQQTGKTCNSYSAEALLRSNETMPPDSDFPLTGTASFPLEFHHDPNLIDSPEMSSMGQQKQKTYASRTRKQEYWRGQEFKNNQSPSNMAPTFLSTPKVASGKKTADLQLSFTSVPEVRFSTPQTPNLHLTSSVSAPLHYPRFPSNPPAPLLTGPNFPHPKTDSIFPPSPGRQCGTDARYAGPRKPYIYPRSSTKTSYPYPMDSNRKSVGKSSAIIHQPSISSIPIGGPYSKSSVSNTIVGSPLPIAYPSKSIQQPSNHLLGSSFSGGSSYPTKSGSNIQQSPNSGMPSSPLIGSYPSKSAINVQQTPNPALGSPTHYPKPSGNIQQSPNPLVGSPLSVSAPYLTKSSRGVQQSLNPVVGPPLPIGGPYPPFPPLPPHTPGSSGSSLANFNLTTIFPEMNKKGYQYT